MFLYDCLCFYPFDKESPVLFILLLLLLLYGYNIISGNTKWMFLFLKQNRVQLRELGYTALHVNVFTV